MSHTVAINVLSDEVDDIQKNIDQMTRSLAGLLARKQIFHAKIREDAILRLRRSIREHQERLDSIKSTIGVLEEAMRIAPVVYGIKRKGSSEVFEIEGLSYSEARDLCEAGGAQLYKKNYKGIWEEA